MAKEGEGKINEALHEISEYLRSIEKYYDDDQTSGYNEKLFKKIRELIGESGIWDMMQ